MALKRVMIVEDSIDVGRMYQDTIRSAYPNAGTTFVPSAEEGILEATRYSFDLIVADIRLPGISGFDLVRKVRVRQPDVKAIMVTGLKIDEDLEKQCKLVGADLLLPKPIGVAEFIQALEQVTGETAQAGAAEASAARPKRSGRTGGLRRAANEPKTSPLAAQRQAEAAAASSAAKSRGDQPEPEAPTLGSALAELRGSLGALAVIFLDDQGRVVAQAGEWPAADLEARLVPEVMAGLSALEKVSLQIHSGLPVAAHALRGQTFDLAFAPVGRFALLVFLRTSTGALRLALAFDQLLTTQVLLAGILGRMGLIIRPYTGILEPPAPAAADAPARAQAPAEAGVEAEPEDPAKLQALEALLGKAGKQAVKGDADAFWDEATSGESSSSLPSSGALSYEQAQKLGLVGDEK
jgi:CheY-like chemotaxis protein